MFIFLRGPVKAPISSFFAPVPVVILPNRNIIIDAAFCMQDAVPGIGPVYGVQDFFKYQVGTCIPMNGHARSVLSGIRVVIDAFCPVR